MSEPQTTRLSRNMKARWLVAAFLIAGTVLPKAEPGHGVILGNDRRYIGAPSNDWYDENIYLAEGDWFNRGYTIYHHWEQGHGHSMARSWLPGCYWGWMPVLVVLLVVGARLLPPGYRSRFVRFLRVKTVWLFFGIVWLGAVGWLAVAASRMVVELHSETIGCSGLILFLSLNGAILLYAMDGRRLRMPSAMFWYTLRGWSQSYLVYLTVLALLLWRQETWPFMGLPFAAGGAFYLWQYTDQRIRQLRHKAVQPT